MAKSRTNKGREAKVAEFKQKVKKQNKKSMEIPKFRPFRQVPHYEPDAQIALTGQQFSLLQNFFGVFAEPINVMQDVFSTNLNNGVITIKYIDNDGKEVSKEEVQEYMKEVQKYLEAQAKETSPEAVVTTNVDNTQEDSLVEAVTPEVTQEENPSKRKLKVVTD